MKRTTRSLFLPLAAFVLLAAFPPATKADPVGLTINNTATGFSGDVLTFQGTLTNLGAPAVFLNSLSFTFPAGFAVNDAPFFALPAMLTPGQSTGLATIFTVTIGNVAQGIYLGSITILGGQGPNALNSLVTRDFQIAVVPEPGTLALVGGALALARLTRRRKRA